jgi:hypothetical protein
MPFDQTVIAPPDQRDDSPVPDRLLNSEQAAVYLNVPLSSLRNQRKAWGLHPTKVGRALQFRQSELDDLLERNREGRTPIAV